MKQTLKNFTEPLLLGLILIDVILLITITFFQLPQKTENIIIIFDLIVCLLLLTEFIVHLIKSENKTKYVKEHWFELVSAIPIDLFFLRFLRFVRIFRVLKLVKIATLLKTDTYLLKTYLKHTNILRLLVMISLIVIATTIILFIIDPNITTILDSLWYVVVTVTSVGYGDITPTSTVGKIVGLFLVIVGFILISIFIGAISSMYQSKFSNDDELLEIIKNQNQKIDELTNEVKELKNKIEK